jgi:hypothetical protein
MPAGRGMKSPLMAIRERSAGPLVSDPILNWRLEQLMQAGYEAEDALQLAVRAEVDLHRAVSLLREGCPPKTALRILL